MKSGYESLVALPGVGVSMADALYEKGLFSAEEISRATLEDLIQIRGIGEEKAKKLIAAASQLVKAAVEEAESEEIIEDESEDVPEEKLDNRET
jgi:N utilization substance protein A